MSDKAKQHPAPTPLIDALLARIPREELIGAVLDRFGDEIAARLRDRVATELLGSSVTLAADASETAEEAPRRRVKPSPSRGPAPKAQRPTAVRPRADVADAKKIFGNATKECPTCHRTMPIATMFGARIAKLVSGDVVKPQSNCRDCRAKPGWHLKAGANLSTSPVVRVK